MSRVKVARDRVAERIESMQDLANSGQIQSEQGQEVLAGLIGVGQQAVADADDYITRRASEMTKATEQNGHIVLSLDQIMAADDLQTEWVAIPEWAPKGAENAESYGVYVRSLNGKERADWQQASVIGTGKNTHANFQQSTVKLVALASVDGSGKRVFSGVQASALHSRNSAILERIAEVAMKLSGIGEAEMATISGNSTGNEDSLTS